MNNPSSAGQLVALVVTHNRLAQLKVTIARLRENTATHLCKLVVFDNASSDGTASWLAQINDPRLYVHRNDTNIGGAGGFSKGMRLVQEKFDPDWIVVMDDDARPEPEALATFHASDLTEWDAVAAAVYLPNGDICEMNRPSRNPFWHLPDLARVLLGGGRRGFHLRSQDYLANTAKSVDVTSFVGFFISRRGLTLAGYPDANLFIYGDDGLYSLGLTKSGGRIGFHPSVRFEHDLTTFQQHNGRFTPLWKVYYYHRNLLLLYRVAAGWLFGFVLLIYLPKWTSKIRVHAGQRRTFARLMWHAVADGLLRRTNIPHEQVLDWAGDAVTGHPHSSEPRDRSVLPDETAS